MGDYTKKELLDAIEDMIDEDNDFAEELEDAIDSKNKSWIRKLIERVAEEIWGYLKNSFVGWIFKKLVGL